MTKIKDIYGDRITVGEHSSTGGVVLHAVEHGIGGATLVLSNKARKKLRRALKRRKS